VKRSVPYVVFEATRVCNLACRYCYNPWKRAGEHAAVPEGYHAAKKTLRRLFSIARVQQLTMSGGEPFLAERFSELVLYSRMKKARVVIISNGNTAGESDLKTMIDLGVGLFEFPLHAPVAAVHDELSGVPGSWERVCQSVKHTIKLGAEAVGVIVLTKQNIHLLEATLQFHKSMGISRVMLNRFNIGGSGVENADFLGLSVEQLRHGFGLANSLARQLNISIHSGVCTPVCVLDPKHYPEITFGSCGASVANRPITLDTAGNLRLCNHSPVYAGNIFKQSLDEIFASEYVRSWDESTPSFCRGCADYTRCFAGCRAAAEQTGKSIMHPDPILLCSDR
jgi:radical SAM protein with 4Fe4S-binding SPASM domain